MEEQKIAYIPIIAPDALTMLPDGKMSSAGEMGSAIPLIRGLDKSVRELKDDLWAFRKGTDSAIAELKQNVSILTQDVSDLKQDVSVLKQDVSILKDDVSSLKGNVKALDVRVDGFDKRLDDMHQSQSKWFMLLGILVAVVPIAVALVQSFMKG